MTGFELRLWRKSLGWSRDRAAEELGVCLRAYKDYENAPEVKRAIELATITLALRGLMPVMQHYKTGKLKMLEILQQTLRTGHNGYKRESEVPALDARELQQGPQISSQTHPHGA